MSKELKRSELVAAAKELNGLGFDPAADLKAKPEKLTAWLKEANGFLKPDDKISDATRAVLDAVAGAEPGVDAGVPDEAADAGEPVDLRAALAGAKKLVDLKALVTSNDAFKKLRKRLAEFAGMTGPRLLRAEMEKCLPKTTAAAPAADVKEKAKAAPAKAKKQVVEKKSCYGHRVGSMSGLIDEALAAGTTRKALVAKLLKAFPDRDERRVTNKLDSHIKYLPGARGVTVIEEGGKFSVKK